MREEGYLDSQDYRGFYWGRKAKGTDFDSWRLPSRNEGVVGQTHKYNITWDAGRAGFRVQVNSEELAFAYANNRRISRMQTGAETNECQGYGGLNSMEYTPQIDWAWWDSNGTRFDVVLTDTSNTNEPGHSYYEYVAGGWRACALINRPDYEGC